MKVKQNTTVPEPAVRTQADPYQPKKLTVAENAMLTVKVMVSMGVIGSLLWGISLWTSPQ